MNIGVRFGDNTYSKYNLIGRVYDDVTNKSETENIKYATNTEPYTCFKISNASVNDR